MSIDNPDASPGENGLVSPDLQAQAKQDLGKVTDQAKHDLDAITQRAADDVRELGHEANAKVEEATEKAKSFAGEQKDMAAGQINGVAAAVGKVADELDGSEQQALGRHARDLAAGLSSLGKTIEDRDVDDLMGMAQDFGRKQPVAFLGAAALAGFVASRFALASAHRRDNKPVAGGNSAGIQTNSYRSDAAPSDGSGQSDGNRSGGLDVRSQ